MNSLSCIVQVVLVVMMATLLAHHLQLKQKYEELKVSCERSCVEKQPQEGVSIVDIESRETLKMASNKIGNFVMHSSSKVENERKVAAVARDGYVDENEPTLFNALDLKEDVTFTFSTEKYGRDGGGPEFQISNTEDQHSVIQATEENVNTLAEEFMISTNEGDIYINPSTSLPIQFTEKQVQPHEPVSQIKMQNLTQLGNYEIDPSATQIQELMMLQESENAFEIYDNSKDTNEINDKITLEIENNSDPGQKYPDDSSSESTEIEGIFVLETSLVDSVNKDAENNEYFETQDSTSVLNTKYYLDTLDHMTGSTDYTGNCDEENCELLYDDEEEDKGEEGLMNSIRNDKLTHNIDNGVKGKMAEEVISNGDGEDLIQLMAQGSSVRCDGNAQMTCRFQNLCYNTKERDFVFFKGENSIVEMVQSKPTKYIFDINLATIQGHNSAMFSVITLPAHVIDQFSIGTVRKRAVAINRFKPDNIMHVLHDDVLPLFHTLDHFKFARHRNIFDAAIIFTDAYEGGSYFDFYSSLSTVVPISPWKFNQTYDLLCFSDIQIGLQTSTVWYQYGFFQPQGPSLPLQENMIEIVHKAADYLSVQFNSECFLCNKGNYLVFLSRKDNRLILNEGELIMSLMKSTRLKIMSVSLETHSLSDIVTITRRSRGVFGMHGSLLSLAMFLPPGSILIELFPFAVNPSKYTPFKTFCDLPKSGLIYKSWANPSKDRSVPHPDWPASEGGISHLPKHKQEEITGQTEVPEHLCCEDPSWLYHIYQDTYVDINEVVFLISEAILEAGNIQKSTTINTSKILSIDIPGSVKNLRCENLKVLEQRSKHIVSSVVAWDAPWVFSYDTGLSEQYQYELVIQEENSKQFSTIFLPSDQLSYHFDSNSKGQESDTAHNVWVRVLTNDGVKSGSKFVNCAT